MRRDAPFGSALRSYGLRTARLSRSRQKRRIRLRDASRILDQDLRHDEREQTRGHRHPMIVARGKTASEHAGPERSAAHDQRVRLAGRIHAGPVQDRDERVDPIALLDAQVPDAVEPALSGGERGARGERGHGVRKIRGVGRDGAQSAAGGGGRDARRARARSRRPSPRAPRPRRRPRPPTATRVPPLEPLPRRSPRRRAGESPRTSRRAARSGRPPCGLARRGTRRPSPRRGGRTPGASPR